MAALRLGDTAPNFSALTTEGQIMFHEWLVTSGEYYFHIQRISHLSAPQSFGTVSKLRDEFEKETPK